MTIRFHIVLFVALSLGLLPPAFAATEAPVKFRLAYGTTNSGYSGVWVAKDAGIFARNGLDLELLMIQSSPILAAAMVSGSVPVAVMGGSAALASNLAGSDLVLIGSLRKISSLAFFVTSKEISKPEQLRGKTLGIDRYGGSGDLILKLVLGKLGFNPEKDVIIRQVGQSPVRLTALQTGAIHGTILSAEDKVAADRLGLPVLVDVSKLGVELLGADLITTRSLIKRKNRRSGNL
jgi:NitT/TauT family transport system substrate-binding protein